MVAIVPIHYFTCDRYRGTMKVPRLAMRPVAVSTFRTTPRLRYSSLALELHFIYVSYNNIILFLSY